MQDAETNKKRRLKTAPTTGKQKRKAQQPGVPSHRVEPRESSNFTGKHIDMDRAREPADLSGVLRVAHDIKIGLNRYEMF